MVYNYESPDGFTISLEDFDTIEEAQDFYKEWKAQYKKQGYYSSMNFGKIELSDLDNYCKPVNLIQ